jgi:ribosomal protein S18 acetylase RimI-like enzyme
MRLFRTQPRILPAARGEAPAIAGVYARAWEPCRGRLDDRLVTDLVASADEVGAWLEGGFEVFTANLEGQLAGVVRCSFPTGTCLIDRIAVDPTCAGRGAGRALIEHCVARARRAGVTKVWVQVPVRLPAVFGLFRALGFRESGHLRAHYWGEDIVLMELPV